MIPGGFEWIILFALVLLLFGSKKLPELARGLGRSITNFKSGLHEEQEDDETETTAEQKKEVPQKEEVS